MAVCIKWTARCHIAGYTRHVYAQRPPIDRPHRLNVIYASVYLQPLIVLKYSIRRKLHLYLAYDRWCFALLLGIFTWNTTRCLVFLISLICWKSHHHHLLIPLSGVGTTCFLLPFSSITCHLHAHSFYSHNISSFTQSRASFSLLAYLLEKWFLYRL
jgi:hypothetical protein